VLYSSLKFKIFEKDFKKSSYFEGLIELVESLKMVTPYNNVPLVNYCS